MGDSKRRKLSDPSYGESYRGTGSVSHLIGVPDELLTGKFADIKARMSDTPFDYWTPALIKKVSTVAKEQKLDKYILISTKPGKLAHVISIESVIKLVADLIDEKILHPCAAQEFADVLAQTDNPNNIKYLSIIHNEQDRDPVFTCLLKLIGIEACIFLTVHNISRL